MNKGFTRDPDIALSGLLGIALLGVLTMGAGLIVSGVIEQSWIQILGGAAFLGYVSWMVWRAGQIVRRALKNLRQAHTGGRHER